MIAALLTFSKALAWIILAIGACATVVLAKSASEDYDPLRALLGGSLAVGALGLTALAFAWIASTWGVSA